MLSTRSSLGRLSQLQITALDYWMFDERPKASLLVITRRIERDFGVRASVSMLSRWRKERKLDRLLESVLQADRQKATGRATAFQTLCNSPAQTPNAPNESPQKSG
jgi:hypothetical protein